MAISDTHTCSSRASSHTQLTASRKGPYFEEPVSLHVVLPIAYINCFRTYPHACCESGSYPIFFFPSSYLDHQCDGMGELSLRLDGIFQVSSTEDRQNCLKTYSLVNSALSLGIWPRFPVFSSNGILCSSHSDALIGESLYACPPITGPGNKCQNIVRFTQLEPQGLLCHRGSPFRRRSRGQHSLQRQTHSTPITSPVWKGTPFRVSCVADFHPADDPEPAMPAST